MSSDRRLPATKLARFPGRSLLPSQVAPMSLAHSLHSEFLIKFLLWQNKNASGFLPHRASAMRRRTSARARLRTRSVPGP